MGHWKTREKSGDFEMGLLYELWVGSAWRYGALTLFSTGDYILHFRTKNEGINSQYISTRAALNAEIPSATKISIWHSMVVLWNSHTVKQSKWCFVWLKLSTTAVEAPLHFGCAFSMCTGVETVKQSLNSIEPNNGLFHSLNAHRHNANK